MDRETLRKLANEKRCADKNSNNEVPPDKNSTEVTGENNQKVSKVSPNLGGDTLEKFKSDTFDTSAYISPQTSVEFSSPKDEETQEKSVAQFMSPEKEETEDDYVIIKDNTIKIKGSNKTKLEIYYGVLGTTENHHRIINLKVPRLPQYELIAKKSGEVLKLIADIDFYQDKDKTVYYIRNKKEIVEKLYSFRGQKHLSKNLIGDALDVWLSHINPSVQWKDIREVVREYPEWEEINHDPVGFFLRRSNEVVGNEKLKIAVLLSVVSSHLKKLYGIYRVHLILTGNSGVGKSSTVKSVLKLFYEMGDGVQDWIVLNVTRLTKESLGYLEVPNLDSKIMFVEQLDNIEGVNYLREAMSEGRITTMVPVKTETGDIKTVVKIIPGQPAFVTTNVTANVSHQILNRSIQLYLSPAEDEKLKSKIVETILEREEIEDLERLKLVTYVWLKTRPAPKMTEEAKSQLMKLLTRFINFKNIYRATEITRNMIRATASLFGNEAISESDVNFVMNYFKKDIILTTLELSERDLAILRWMRDHGFVEGEREDETKDVTTAGVAQSFKMSTQEVKKLLDFLYDKGLIWKAYDGKRFSWAINNYGLRVLNELEREVEGEVQEESEVIIEDQLLAYISSKLLGKETVKEEELRGILQKTAQATDIEVQDILIKALEKKGLINNQGDGTWKVI